MDLIANVRMESLEGYIGESESESESETVGV